MCIKIIIYYIHSYENMFFGISEINVIYVLNY